MLRGPYPSPLAFVLAAAVAALACGTATSAVLEIELAPWTKSRPPNALRIDVRDFRPPPGGGAEVVVTIVVTSGQRVALGRFVPSELGAARVAAVRLPLGPAMQEALARARCPRLEVTLAPIAGDLRRAHVEILSAQLERVD